MTTEKFDQNKYIHEFKKKNYDRIEVLVPKGQKAIIKEKAASLGQSMNEFICTLIKENL